MRYYLSKIFLCLLALNSTLCANSPNQIKSEPMGQDTTFCQDIVLGDPNAVMKIIEYSSLNCHVCAEFHTTVLPKLLSKYVYTGQVCYIFRHFPLDEQAAKVATLLAISPQIKHFSLIQKIFECQDRWIDGGDQISKILSGITEIDCDQCQKAMKNDVLINAVLQKRLDAEKQYNIDGTPYFLINGHILDYAPNFEKIESYLKPTVQSSPQS